MDGWIKLHRKLLEWGWFDEPITLWLFMKCLLLANHKDKVWRGITVKKGSFITSYASLSSKKAKVSVQQVRTSLERLKSTREITIKTNNKYTVVTVLNWEQYQSYNTQNNKQITRWQHTDNKQITTTNNDKNVIMKENIYNTPSAIDANVLKEIADKYKVPEAFVISKYDDMINWCDSKGKTYKNYKAALMRWVKDDAIKIIDKDRQQTNKYSVTKV